MSSTPKPPGASNINSGDRSGRRTLLPDPRQSPRFAGISTFCRYPRLADVLPENRPVDWVLYGAPSDAGVTYRPGTRFGPRAIREASQYVKRFHTEHNVDVCDALSLADGGDAPLLPYDLKANLDGIAEFALDLGDDTSKLLAVGGDHSIAYSNIRATWQRQGTPRGGLALIHFDSHLDTVDTVWGERWSHASPFRRLIEEGIVNPRQMLSIGIKGPLNGAADLEYARTAGVTLVMREDLLRPDLSPQTTPTARSHGHAAIARFLSSLGDSPAYISYDIDVVDPAFAPGTGTPSIGGLSSTEALELLRLCRGVRIAGADVVEVLPDRDVAGNTALLAAHIMFEILALDASLR